MSIKNTKSFTEEEIKKAIESSVTMGGAAKVLHVDWRTFKKEAEKYKLYKPCEASRKEFNLEDILSGKHPQYPTSKLLKRLVKANLKKYECEECHVSKWNEKPISLEINHIDGDNGNHSLDNLMVLCPNCHSQTDNYRGKNIHLRKINM